MNTAATLRGIGMTSLRTRERMIERLREQGIRDERVLAAMGNVPRHIFVEEALASRAYEDTALPLGFQQTISQPYVVARMIELLLDGPQPRELGRTLEVGAGCGYQAAVLALLTRELYAIERIDALLVRARKHLAQLRLGHVRMKHADGSFGLPEAAPFMSIIVAAAASRIPQTLLDQLAPGGRLILPLAGGGGKQILVLVERNADGSGFRETHYDAVRFVPLVAGVE
ncbi:L-isoaspartate protein carboxylmethyltransferase type II [Sterolibacterium denitrificans]|uniref:Protein-L-isoaspartate O-methyltransferase n=2 Tax=Sterolibacterium denitrificans TaxID=157592 RepID=A0A656ZA12_9PROT|nr:protein-L-isoaspartate(D-aspartate) O-methyltransferase [Sterolibacterium denitrificans]KYC29336.1 protein-L-isoaspartate O-methyltransferase [Sterolibacterium denitrificans]SMB30866.1 L-isoaspartate protein carboxylmethyltransferase type II [Sterolibacterium denitrificans]